MMKPPVSGGFVMLKYGNMEMFLLGILQTTVVQLIGILGLFFILGFILSKLQEWTQRNYQRSIGWKGILWTAWIGTPFHELGHAFFVKLFRHQITRIALFQPNQATGELGQVEHRYNPASLYQKIGNFFIGAAPMIFGSIVLWLLVRWLLPDGESVFVPLLAATGSFSHLRQALSESVSSLFTLDHLHNWSFWLFIYISFSIASHLAPSKIDRQSMWSGLRWIFGILLLINFFAVILRVDITNYLLRTTQSLTILTAIFLYAILISAIHWLLSAMVLRPWRK